MGKKEENTKQPPTRSKLLMVKEWLTVPEAARHMSILFGEEVSEADVLRLALDNHLKLSVNFVNFTKVKHGIAIPWDDVAKDPAVIISKLNSMTEAESASTMAGCERVGRISSLYSMTEAESANHAHQMKILHGREDCLHFYDDVTNINGVWDLPMFGGERLDIEHRYQQLTDGPDVDHFSLDGVIVEREDGQLCQLQEYKKIDEEKAEKCLDEELKQFIKSNDPDSYGPTESLPADAVLVVRTSALFDLQERLSSENTAKVKPLGSVERRSLLKMILAMAIEGYRYNPSDAKSSIPLEITEDVANNDHSIDVDTVRKWLKEAVKLPKDPM